LEPRDGVEVMRRRRGDRVPDRRLTDGPGKLCAALLVSQEHDGVMNAPTSVLRTDGTTHDARRTIVVTPRIGISRAADWPLRFVLPGR
jgi:DNA-3-methyladenine glycosylase